MEQIYNLMEKAIRDLKATIPTQITDEVYIETHDEGNHYFNGQVKIFGHIFWIEGNAYTYVCNVERDENGGMFADTETEIDIDKIWSGADCEVEHKSYDLDNAIKAKLLN